MNCAGENPTGAETEVEQALSWPVHPRNPMDEDVLAYAGNFEGLDESFF